MGYHLSFWFLAIFILFSTSWALKLRTRSLSKRGEPITTTVNSTWVSSWTVSNQTSLNFQNTIVPQLGNVHYPWYTTIQCENASHELFVSIGARSFSDVLTSPWIPLVFNNPHPLSRNTSFLKLQLQIILNIQNNGSVVYLSSLSMKTNITLPLFSSFSSLTTSPLMINSTRERGISSFLSNTLNVFEDNGIRFPCTSSCVLYMQTGLQFYNSGVNKTKVNISCLSFRLIALVNMVYDEPTPSRPSLTPFPTTAEPSPTSTVTTSTVTPVLHFESSDFARSESTISKTMIVGTSISVIILVLILVSLLVYAIIKITLRRKYKENVKNKLEKIHNSNNAYAFKTEDVSSSSSFDSNVMNSNEIYLRSDEVILYDSVIPSNSFSFWGGVLMGTRVCPVSFKKLGTDELAQLIPDQVYRLLFVDHKNVIKVHGLYYGELSPSRGGNCFLVFEEVDTKSNFANWINNPRHRNQLGINDYAYFAKGLTSALEYLHSQDIILQTFTIDDVFYNPVDDERGPFPLHFVEPKLSACSISNIQLVNNAKYAKNFAPPEVTKSVVYTKNMDVWYMGLVIWHVYDNKKNPFGMLVNETFVPSMIQNDRAQPTKPIYAPAGIYEFLKGCWEFDPNNRHSAAKMSSYFNDYYTKLTMDNNKNSRIISKNDSVVLTPPKVANNNVIHRKSSPTTHNTHYVTFIPNDSMTRVYANVPPEVMAKLNQKSPTTEKGIEEDSFEYMKEQQCKMVKIPLSNTSDNEEEEIIHLEETTSLQLTTNDNDINIV